MKKRITILGDGAWGTTLAILLSKNGHDVLVWSIFGDHLEKLDKERENEKYLKGIKIPKDIIFEHLSNNNSKKYFKKSKMDFPEIIFHLENAFAKFWI